MNISQSAVIKGMKVEKEHEGTYKWVSKYFRDHKKMPDIEDFVMKIALDHLREFPDYYEALDKMEKELKKSKS